MRQKPQQKKNVDSDAWKWRTNIKNETLFTDYNFLQHQLHNKNEEWKYNAVKQQYSRLEITLKLELSMCMYLSVMWMGGWPVFRMKFLFAVHSFSSREKKPGFSVLKPERESMQEYGQEWRRRLRMGGIHNYSVFGKRTGNSCSLKSIHFPLFSLFSSVCFFTSWERDRKNLWGYLRKFFPSRKEFAEKKSKL